MNDDIYTLVTNDYHKVNKSQLEYQEIIKKFQYYYRELYAMRENEKHLMKRMEEKIFQLEKEKDEINQNFLKKTYILDNLSFKVNKKLSLWERISGKIKL
jgi:uncharacterized protein Yka (UPF0111/DUF47 family)